MKVSVTYCNHETTSVSLREKIAFASDDDFARGYEIIRSQFPNHECVIVSTCNRIEFYLATDQQEITCPSVDDFVKTISLIHDVSPEDYQTAFRQQCDDHCLLHLFEVASSLDSMVLGEDQIVHQVKASYLKAQNYMAVGTGLHHLFQSALNVASTVRKKTRLSEGKTSIASVAVGEFGRSIFADYTDKQVLVIGAGEMAEEALNYLRDAGVRNTIVINRTYEKAIKLAETFGGTTAPFEDLDKYLASADIIIAATGAPSAWLTAERVSLARKANRTKTQFILDLGAPRDFADDVGRLDDNLFLYNIDDLEEVCQKNRELRVKEVAKARKMIEDAAAKCLAQLRQRNAAPVIANLRTRWEQIGKSEYDRLTSKLSHLPAEDLKQVEIAVDRIINKLLHTPIEAIRKQSLEESHESFVDTLKRLFHLTD